VKRLCEMDGKWLRVMVWLQQRELGVRAGHRGEVSEEVKLELLEKEEIQ
jgi:hypothetical protein